MFYQIQKESKATIILVMLLLKMEVEDKVAFLILISQNTFQIFLRIFLERALVEDEEEEEEQTIEVQT